jgi:ribosomal RNA-processing protein 12
MSDIFTASIDDVSSNIKYQLTDVLRVVLSSPPSKSDVVLSASWVQALGSAMVAYNAVDQTASSEELPKVWSSVWKFLDSSDAATRKATAQSLCALSSCFSPALTSAAVLDQDGSSIIRKIISQITKALDSLAYARSIPELLSIISSIITNLRHRESKTSPTAAELLILPLIVRIGDLRISKGFEHKEAADATLSTAMHIIGPEVLLNALPLNLDPASRYVFNFVNFLSLG